MLRASPSSYTLFFPYLNIYYLLKPLQIYGILLNICGILLNIRGKTEKYGEFHGILWIFHGKCVENHSFLFHFFPFHSSNSCQLTHFRGRFRSFSVVFGRFCGHFRRKSENFGEKWRISENLVEFSRKSFLFIPFLSSIPRFYALQHVFETILSEEWKFLAFFFGGSKYSSYFCQRLQDSSNLLSEGDCFA